MIAAHVQIVVLGARGVGCHTLINTLSRNSLRPLEVERNSPKSGASLMGRRSRDECAHLPESPVRDVIISTTNKRGELKQLGFHFTTDPK